MSFSADTVIVADLSSFEPPCAFAPVDTAAPVSFVTALYDSVAAARPGSLYYSSQADALEALDVPGGACMGIDGVPLVDNYANSTALSALMIGTLILSAVNAPALRRTLKSYRSELWSIRRRPNVFDDERSASLPMAALLALVFIVFGGIVLYNLHGVPTMPSFAGAAASMAVLGTYYVFEYCAYRLVGYAFGSTADMHCWLEGFAASQAFAGLAMVVPALLLVYMPQWYNVLIIIVLAAYALARLVFIAKGFRIFYVGFGSLLYFILYLCSLEIIPLLAMNRVSALIHAGI